MNSTETNVFASKISKENVLEKNISTFEKSDQKKAFNLPINFSVDSITTGKGQSGRIRVQKIEDIEIKGTFQEIKNNPYIDLSGDGSWIAKKAGKTTITPIFDVSKETLNKLKEKYPDNEINWEDTLQVIPISISEMEEITLPIDFSIDSITTTEGQSGMLNVKKFEDIELNGYFQEIKDNPYIELSQDGAWIAKKAGKTTITPIFTVSHETLEKIRQKYPDCEINWEDIAPAIPVTISEKKKINLPINFSANSITTTEGQSGKLSVQKFEDIELNGIFQEIKDNPYIELSQDGSWTAKKAGKTTITPIFDISEAALEKIREKYPDCEINWEDIAQVIPVTINSQILTENEAPKAKQSIQIKKENKPTTVKELPKTGEAVENKFAQLLGLLSISSVGILFQQSKRKKG